MTHALSQWLDAMAGVTLALAPWLLLGVAIAGVLHVALPARFVRRQFSGRIGVLKAVALAVPLPLCSCGVIPAGLGLKRDGASDGATVAFLISTPQTGLEAVLVSASFLGWPFAVFSVVTAAVTGVVGGWLTDAVSRDSASASPSTAAAPVTEMATAEAPRGLREALAHGLDILRTIWRWVVIGVVVSAVIEVFVPPEFFTGLAGLGKVVPILAALAISLPLYVCSTASVPIAAALVAGGMPAGAALVFLIAGPASNVATIGAIYRGLGARALGVYLATIIGGSVTAGLLFDSVIDASAAAVPHAHGETTWWATAAAALLVGMIAWFAFGDLRGFVARLRKAPAGASIEVGVSGMSCNSCVAKLERTLRSVAGVTAAAVTLEPARAVVRGSVDEAAVRAAVEQAGYAVVESARAAPNT